MVKMDSVIRETMRERPFAARALDREVTNPAGLTTPEGLYLPPGIRINTTMSCKQRDTDKCERGDEWVPLRFYEKTDKGRQSAVQISTEFLPFGLGRHAW
jgi:cytochrome P450